jgi:hypothetical protein
VVKVTPGHDFNDFETGKRHHLPLISVLDEAARINAHGGRYAGSIGFEARKKILAEPGGAGAFSSIEGAYAAAAPLRPLRHDRRALLLVAVVREDGDARGARARGRPERTRRVHCPSPGRRPTTNG